MIANSLQAHSSALAAQWHPTRNEGLTPEAVSRSSRDQVWWLCRHGHSWQASVTSRVQGAGCPGCSGRMAVPGVSDLATTSPELAAQWHPTKNGDLTPAEVKLRSTVRVWWRCEVGHEWQAAISSRASGSRCPGCRGRLLTPGVNDLATQRADVAKLWHPNKNGDLTPRDVTPSSRLRVWWACARGHEWQGLIHGRVAAASGCPSCRVRQRRGVASLAQVNPDLAAQWHPTLNGDLTANDVAPKTNKVVWWRCEHGHEWRSQVCNRSYGSGCPMCAHRGAPGPGPYSLASENPELAAQWHPSRNGDLTPDDVRPKANRKVWWRCPSGHEWQAQVANRAGGAGCPHCAGKLAIPGVNDIATIRPDVAAQWHPTKNGHLTPDVVLASSGRRVWWRCPVGHEWSEQVLSRCAGSLCRVCSSTPERTMPAPVRPTRQPRTLAELEPSIAALWDLERNSPLTPEQVTPAAQRVVWWRCETGHRWRASVQAQVAGGACPVCSDGSRASGAA